VTEIIQTKHNLEPIIKWGRRGRLNKPPLEERFWSKVAVTTNPEECWEWQAAKTTKGYGRITVEDRQLRAHRVSWYLTYNHWPELHVLHKCDNPACVNPDHLFLGTDRDNMKDMIHKDRGNHWGHRS
jgi:hypothetical protein